MAKLLSVGTVESEAIQEEGSEVIIEGEVYDMAIHYIIAVPRTRPHQFRILAERFGTLTPEHLRTLAELVKRDLNNPNNWGVNS